METVVKVEVLIMKWIIVPILVALLLILVVSNIVIVQQSRAYVVELSLIHI